MQRETVADIAKIRAHAQQEIAAAGKAARASLKQYAADLSLDLAAQRIQGRLVQVARRFVGFSAHRVESANLPGGRAVKVRILILALAAGAPLGAAPSEKPKLSFVKDIVPIFTKSGWALAVGAIAVVSIGIGLAIYFVSERGRKERVGPKAAEAQPGLS